MPTINQLSQVSSLEPDDQFPIWSPIQGDTRKTTVAAVSDYVIERVPLDLRIPASQVDFTPNGNIVANNVQNAIDEVVTDLAASTGAATVGFAPSGTLSATTVQGAITEQMTDLAASSGSSLVGFLQSGTGATARTVQAKLRDTVSVKDFGAVGDGVTDDTAAIQAAVAANKFVYLPAGTYKVSASIDLKTYPQAGLIGESSELTIIKANAVITQVINLYDTADIGGGNDYQLTNLRIDGNNLATYGVNIRFRHWLAADNVIVQNCTTAWYMADSYISFFNNCRSRNCTNGFSLQGANHASAFSNCYVTAATGVPVYVGGIARVDGNVDVIFNNLIIDHCDTTQIVVDLGSVSPGVVQFNGGYVGEFANNTTTNAIVQVLSGTAVFTGTYVNSGTAAVSPLGMALFRRSGGNAVFKNCYINLQDYSYIYHPSSTLVGSLAIQDCKVICTSYASKLVSGLYNAFSVGNGAYKLPSAHFGRQWTYNVILAAGSTTQSFQGSEAQKALCTSTGTIFDFTLASNPIPDGTTQLLVIIEFSSNVSTFVQIDSTPLATGIASTASVRSTFIALYVNGSEFTTSPTSILFGKDSLAAMNAGEFIQIHKVSIIPVVNIASSLVSFEF